MKKVLQENMKETKVAKSKTTKTENARVIRHSIFLGLTLPEKSIHSGTILAPIGSGKSVVPPFVGLISMKEQWICRCGKDYSSEKDVLSCLCTMNGYTHQFICKNCGRTDNQHQQCCDLFGDGNSENKFAGLHRRES